MSKSGIPDDKPPPYAPPGYDESIGFGNPPPFAGAGQPVITNQPVPIIATVIPLGPDSLELTCPFCAAKVFTLTKSVPSMKAYIMGAILCFIGCDCGCCLIPCCMESCMDVDHQCPNCNKFLGKYNAS